MRASFFATVFAVAFALPVIQELPKISPLDIVFNCSSLPAPPPATDARHLRFGNIKAVMAVGDSITAGFAMKGVPPADFLEYRGQVFDIGGDSTLTGKPYNTMPNFLKNYNKDLQGMAKGTTLPMSKGKAFDAGVSMAKIQDIASQIEYLNKAVKSDKALADDDWKMLTIFIGANNICGACKNRTSSSADVFEELMRKSLSDVRSTFQNVFVNVVTIFKFSTLYQLAQTKAYCKTVFKVVSECGCMTDGDQSDRDAMDVAAVEFNNRSRKVVAEFQAENDPSFYPVIQPFLEDLPIGTPPFLENFLSNLDCFHPSAEANAGMAIGLWNSMQSPEGQKPTSFDLDHLSIKCPTEDTFVQ